jgi:RNA polymerase sigma-70 factor (subfamily 1)
MAEGAAPTSDWQLDRYRGYLLFLARSRLRSVSGKFDASDIVHDVLLKAHRCRDRCRAKTEGERRAWLRRILANAITDEFRRFANEPKILHSLHLSSQRLEQWLEADHTSPSGKVERDELLLQLADALAQLADDERDALEMRYLQEPSVPLKQIAERLNRPTAHAVADLLARGLKRLRNVMRQPA